MSGGHLLGPKPLRKTLHRLSSKIIFVTIHYKLVSGQWTCFYIVLRALYNTLQPHSPIHTHMHIHTRKAEAAMQPNQFSLLTQTHRCKTSQTVTDVRSLSRHTYILRKIKSEFTVIYNFKWVNNKHKIGDFVFRHFKCNFVSTLPLGSFSYYGIHRPSNQQSLMYNTGHNNGGFCLFERYKLGNLNGKHLCCVPATTNAVSAPTVNAPVQLGSGLAGVGVCQSWKYLEAAYMWRFFRFAK